ncbi:uncharacterized protein LOC130771078 [Actinidia eriantha]|uniref:uncharacterized protein LOC130771078 n=1 Tax=Actinidia eriantha TaxID=165200 RepID=UPI00258A0C4D|nr:uncharacterized protein LOC130771078 [Actinidia eriantha]
MFDDHPRKPGRKITCRWLDQNDPDFQIAEKLKQLSRKHATEASFLLEANSTVPSISTASFYYGFLFFKEPQQLAGEEKLANQQAEILGANYKKYEMIDAVLVDGTTANSLVDHYDIKGFVGRGFMR